MTIEEEIKEIDRVDSINKRAIEKLIKFNRNTIRTKSNDYEILGCLISKYVKWQGESIREVFSNALEDSNYHSFNEKINQLWVYGCLLNDKKPKKKQGRLNHGDNE